MLAMIFATVAYIMKKTNQINRLPQLETLAITSLLVGIISLPITIITGYLDAEPLENAVSKDLLAYKIILSMFLLLIVFFLSLILYNSHFKVKRRVYFQENPIPLIFTLLTIIAGMLTSLIGAAGGQYVYGENFLNDIGLSFLIVDFDQPTSNLFETRLEAIFISIVATIVLSFIFLTLLLIMWKLNKSDNH